jgi:lysosomal alpha-mannosidase
VTVNWKMYGGFDPKGEFWTDSNGLEMQKRSINKRDGWEFNGRENPLARNFFPVDSAIAMRSGNTQVTINNDRAQAGSAGNSGHATIELIQHRRQVQNDGKWGLDESLNEVDDKDQGIRVKATYTMQIFDFTKGKSKQRSTQLNKEQPLGYFFSFSYQENKPTVALAQTDKYTEIA